MQKHWQAGSKGVKLAEMHTVSTMNSNMLIGMSIPESPGCLYDLDDGCLPRKHLCH